MYTKSESGTPHSLEYNCEATECTSVVNESAPEGSPRVMLYAPARVDYLSVGCLSAMSEDSEDHFPSLHE